MNMWKIQNLSLFGKITIFERLGLSIIRLALVTNVLTANIELLSKVQKEFFSGKSKAKIKPTSLCNDHENGGFKSVDIYSQK